MNARASREARKAASEAAGAVKVDVGEALGKTLDYMRGVERKAVQAVAAASALGKRVADLERPTTFRERMRWLLTGR